MGKTTRRNRNWSHELATFEAASHQTRTFNLSSPGVAQVTRVRLLDRFDTDISIRTVGSRLILEK